MKSVAKALSLIFEEDGGVGIVNGEAVCQNIMRRLTSHAEKYNTYQRIRQGYSMSEEFFRIYQARIISNPNVEKSVMFLQALERILPEFQLDEVKLWLKIYLSPVLDSAGVNLKITEAARAFLTRITGQSMPTDDKTLAELRQKISEFVINLIVLVYIQDRDTFKEYLNIDSFPDTHEFYERLRFIKQNCRDFLHEFGLRKSLDYFNILETHFKNPVTRLESTNLISKMLSIHSSQAHSIVDTSLFTNLLKSLLYDSNDALIVSTLLLLVFLIPQIIYNIASILPEIFTVYLKLLCKDLNNDDDDDDGDMGIKDYIENQQIDWKLSLENQGSVYSMASDTRLELTTFYLATYLYGAFPRHFIKFSKNPMDYLSKNQPKMLHPNLIFENSNRSAQKNPNKVAQDRSLSYLRSFSIHPSLISEENTFESELKNPFKWIIDEHPGDPLGPEMISVSCLSLNPALIETIPGFLTELLASTLSKFKTPTVSRHSSIVRKHSAGALAVPRMLPLKSDRKFSVVPTNLVLDNNRSQDIIFKDVKFGEGKSHGAVLTTEPSPELQSSNSNDSINELLLTHEALFLHDYSNSKADFKTDSRTEFKADFKMDFKTEKSDPIKSSRLHSSSFSEKATEGSSLTFFQRELLILKNELEFRSYTRRLMEFNYMNARLELNQLRQKLIISKDYADKNAFVPKASYDALNQAFKDLSVLVNQDRNEDLMNGIEKLGQNCLDLKRKLAEALSKLEFETTESKRYRDELNALNDSEKQSARVRNLEEEKSRSLAKSQTRKTNGTAAIIDEKKLDDTEKALVKLQREKAVLQEAIERLQREMSDVQNLHTVLIKHYESKLENMKEELGDQARSLTRHYQKQVQELTAMNRRYETLIEELNSHPVPIFRRGELRDNDVRSMMLTGSSGMRVSNSHSGDLNANTQTKKKAPSAKDKYKTPIMKGRGGYQKRSKLLM